MSAESRRATGYPEIATGGQHVRTITQTQEFSLIVLHDPLFGCERYALCHRATLPIGPWGSTVVKHYATVKLGLDDTIEQALQRWDAFKALEYGECHE